MNKKIPLKFRTSYGSFQVIDKLLGRSYGFKITKKWRRLFYHNVEKYLRENRSPGSSQIREVNLSGNLTNIPLHSPVVFRGFASNWNCCKEWSLPYFKKLHGQDEVVLSGDSHIEVPFELMHLGDLIDNIEQGGDKYYRFYPLLQRHPQHYKDFDTEWLRNVANRKAKGSESFQVFIGGKDRYTPLHAAVASNLFVQVTGKKHWMIMRPSETMIIDPNPGHNFHRSAPHRKTYGAFNPFSPDFETPYHLFKYAEVFETILHPGDILYNPPYFWHSVKNLETSIGVGYRWVNWSDTFKSAPLYTILDLLQLNPPIWKIWKQQKGDYNELHIKELGFYDELENQRSKRNSI